MTNKQDGWRERFNKSWQYVPVDEGFASYLGESAVRKSDMEKFIEQEIKQAQIEILEEMYKEVGRDMFHEALDWLEEELNELKNGKD